MEEFFRCASVNGPSLRVEQYLTEGHEYRISAWVRLISPNSSQLQLSTQVGSGGSASYNIIQGRTFTSAEGWVKLEGLYRYNSLGNGFVTIYIESSNNANASFYIDDIKLEPTSSGPIEVDLTLPSIKEIYEDYFMIGSAVSSNEFEGNRLRLLKHHFNVVTAENAMKPGYAYDTFPYFDFTAEDALVDGALTEGFLVAGHVLVWHQQSVDALHTAPNGDPLPREEALDNLRRHITTVVEHFGDRVISWDVVNEAIVPT